jgi:geranylgeranylglycerol-phosphate geranylgeranyltransferase
MLSLLGVIRLIRPVNAVIVFLAVIAGAATVSRAFLRPEVLIGALSASLILMSGNAVNDVFDIEADKVNRPQRPLPRGDLSINQALAISLVLAGLALVLVLFVNFTCFLIALFYAAMFFAYAIWLKPTGLLGNVLVSSATAMSFIFGSFTVDGINLLTMIFAICAFILNLGREIVKGAEDLEGDKARNCRTIARSYGLRAAGLAVVACYAVLLPLSLTPFLLGCVGPIYLASMLAADTVVLFAIKESSALSTRNASKSSRLIKLSMVLGTLAFFAGAITR